MVESEDKCPGQTERDIGKINIFVIENFGAVHDKSDRDASQYACQCDKSKFPELSGYCFHKILLSQ
jgi:hypothetical protein